MTQSSEIHVEEPNNGRNVATATAETERSQGKEPGKPCVLKLVPEREMYRVSIPRCFRCQNTCSAIVHVLHPFNASGSTLGIY